MKVSIVIPVYNVEPYIEKCIESLLNQDLAKDDYEIIFINDGSPDNSKAIIEKYQSQHSNIVLLNQENKGVSAARNVGIDISKGNYIFFLDADDSLYENVLGKLYHYATTENIDLLYVKIDYFNEAGVCTGEFKMDSPKIEILDGFQHQRRGFICGLYKKESIEGIRFQTDIPMGEDALFNIMVHTVAKRVSYSNFPCYKYLIRESSVSHNNVKNAESVFEGFLKTIDILKDYRNSISENLTASEFNYFNRPFTMTCRLALVNIIIPTRDAKKYAALRAALEKNKLNHIIPAVRVFTPPFGKPALIFFGYYALKKIVARFKRYKKTNHD